MGGFRADFPDPRKALAPITQLVTVPVGIAVSSTSPVKTLKDFIELGKGKTQNLSYSIPAIGTHMHLVGELFKMETGIEMQAVPYKGTGPAAAALVAGEVQATVSDMSSLLPQSRGGKVIILGMTDPRRSAVVPDIPTVAEQSVPGFGLSAWIGMFAPARAPQKLVETLNAEVVKILAAAEVRNALVTAGLDPSPTTIAQFTEIMDRDIKKWAGVVKQANIKFQ
jgi:tripartite-type tricarboxylate transporter receptor subunit TctC